MHASAAVPIATTAAAGAAATTSSSSRLCICCAVAETVATSPTTSRGKRGEHQSVLALSLAPTSTPNPQLQPTDPAILPSDCQQLSCQHPTGQPTGHQQRQGQQHHQEQDQEPEFHQGPFHVTDDLQHPASEAASERHQLLDRQFCVTNPSTSQGLTSKDGSQQAEQQHQSRRVRFQ